MKRLCLLLALLLLVGCGKTAAPPPSPPTTTTATTTTAQTSDTDTTPILFDVYAVNDLHGKIADTATQPGVDELTTYLKQAEQAGNTLLLSVGDMWQGAAESNLTGGRIVTDWMNELDFAAMTLGGHEYDWGEEQIYRNKEAAEFPFLAINIYDRETNKQVDYCQSSVVVEMEGAQIGVIGAIGNCYYSISSEHTEEVYFKTGDALTALVKAEAEKLRGEGVDFIIYAIHDGYDRRSTTQAVPVTDEELEGYYDITLSDGYVDLVLEADSHFTYALTDRYGVYHLQAGGNNNGISHATVRIDLARNETEVIAATPLSSATYSDMADDPVVARLLEQYSEQITSSERVVGVNNHYRSKAGICKMVANLYCAAGVARWGADYDIVLGGGYISCRSPGYLPAGEVTYSQLMALLPFDNTITLCSVRGRDLVSRFLETEVEAYYVTTTEYGDSILDAIDPNATYYLVTDSYTAYYSYNNLTVVDTFDEGVYARDLLAEYIAAGNLQD